MTNPGYGPNGFKINPVGLTSWAGASPPILVRNSSAVNIPTIGFGRIPRRVLDSNETLKVKEY